VGYFQTRHNASHWRSTSSVTPGDAVVSLLFFLDDWLPVMPESARSNAHQGSPDLKFTRASATIGQLAKPELQSLFRSTCSALQEKIEMYNLDLQKFQYVARSYHVVVLSRDGERTILSRHNSFLSADRSRKTIPTEEDVEIRIESVPVEAAVRLVG
jgi:hypothetical protein